jgi:hypothetical protein
MTKRIAAQCGKPYLRIRKTDFSTKLVEFKLTWNMPVGHGHSDNQILSVEKVSLMFRLNKAARLKINDIVAIKFRANNSRVSKINPEYKGKFIVTNVVNDAASMYGGVHYYELAIAGWLTRSVRL